MNVPKDSLYPTSMAWWSTVNYLVTIFSQATTEGDKADKSVWTGSSERFFVVGCNASLFPKQ